MTEKYYQFWDPNHQMMWDENCFQEHNSNDEQQQDSSFNFDLFSLLSKPKV